MTTRKKNGRGKGGRSVQRRGSKRVLAIRYPDATRSSLRLLWLNGVISEIKASLESYVSAGGMWRHPTSFPTTSTGSLLLTETRILPKT